MSSIEKKESLKQKPGHFVKSLKKKGIANKIKKKTSSGKPFDVDEIAEEPSLIRNSDEDGSKAKKKTESNKIKNRKTAEDSENVIEIDEQVQSKSSIIKTSPEIVPRLYIRFKKTIKDMGMTHADLVAMHPLIKSVRLPRKKETSKFFFAIFGSELKAVKAAKALMERKDCFVRPAFKVTAGKSADKGESNKKLKYFWN